MKQAITRLVVLAVLLLNQVLITFGWDPLPFEEEQIYKGASTVLTVAMAIYTWWKNSPISKEAQDADEIMKAEKKRKKLDKKTK